MRPAACASLAALVCAGVAHAGGTPESLSPADAAVYHGMDAAVNAEAFAGYADGTLLDHEWRDVSEPSLNMSSFAERCQTSLKRAIWEEERGLPPHLYVDPLDGVAVGERAQLGDPRIVYFIGVSRPSGAIIASRLLRALHHSSHLYIIHVDLKADPSVYAKLFDLTRDHPNMRLLSTRRMVQWAGFTMVSIMLDAIASIVARNLDFDFFINLSDADMSLRTDAEVVEFLRPYKGRQFVQVHAGNGEWLQRARNFTGAHAVVECGGYGFVSLNDSAPLDIGGGSPSCCFGRGGPVVYANETRLHLREARAALRAEAASQAAMAARAAADDGGDGGEGAGGRGEEERGGRGEGGGEEGSGGRGEWGSETGAGRVEDGGGGGAREGGVGDGCVGGSMPHASAEAGGGGVGREEAATGSMADAARAGAETAEAARTAAAVGPAVTSAAAVTDGLAEAVTAAAAAAAAEREAAVESLRYLHTGSQWVVLDRAFCHYLITDTRAIRWRKVFASRFLADESFVQTVLMHSPFARTNINNNLRYIMWPQFYGDPTSYWMRMGWAFVGGPTVINATEAKEVFKTPYLVARKVDPLVDAETVRLYDVWMGAKLANGTSTTFLNGSIIEQEPLGGRSQREQQQAMAQSRKQAARKPGAAGGEGGGVGAWTGLGSLRAGDGGVAAAAAAAAAGGEPRSLSNRPRRVAAVTFTDGSSCECSPGCAAAAACCDDWPQLCAQLQNAQPPGEEPPARPPPCAPAASPPLESLSSAGAAVRLTLVNLAWYPVRLFFLRPGGGEPADAGTIEPHGGATTVDTADTHAWAVRAFSGASVLEIAPLPGGRPSRWHVDIDECDPGRAAEPARQPLHEGWR